MPLKDPEALRAYKAAWAKANHDRMNASNRAYRERNPDKNKEYARKHRQENPGKDREYYLANRERILAQMQWYRATNHEEVQQRRKTYRDTHKEERKAYDQLLYQKDGATIRKRTKAWRKANPDKFAVYRKSHRARKRNATINDLTADQWQTIQEHFAHRCAYCHKRCKGRLTEDHIQPLSKGGNHTMSNIVPACASCNAKKHVGPPLHPVQPLLL